ncbi:uncharacterized protein LOC135210507 [Macrobrachium nipponense]|uniref:uncharacterized protein LOC135210507 n=1 Tax=Macrobrachium nipponense TaxID=159736 RepID=UPI0030C83931
MALIFVSLLSLSLAMGTTEAIRPTSLDGKGILSSILGGDENCPDPSEFMVKLTEATCCQGGCAKEAATCMQDLTPDNVDKCLVMKECRPKPSDIRTILQGGGEPHKVIMGMIVECSDKKRFQAMNITFVENDPKQSELNFLNKIVKDKNLGTVGQAIVSAVETGRCVPPKKEDFTIGDKIGYQVCLLKTCADSKAAAAAKPAK